MTRSRYCGGRPAARLNFNIEVGVVSISGGNTAPIIDTRCLHCGRVGRAVLLCRAQAHHKEAKLVINEVIDYLEQQFARGLPAREIAGAYSRAVVTLGLLGEHWYPGCKVVEERLCSPEIREAGQRLFDSTLREIIRQLLDGRMEYAEGSEGLQLLHQCAAAIGEERVGEIVDEEAIALAGART